MVHCPSCGCENHPARTICHGCNAALPVGGVPASPQEPANPPDVPYVSSGMATRWLWLAWVLAMALGGALVGIVVQIGACGAPWMAALLWIGIPFGGFGLGLIQLLVLGSLPLRKASWVTLSGAGWFFGAITAVLASLACFMIIPALGNQPLVDVLGQFRYALPGLLTFGVILGATQARALPQQSNAAWWLPTTTASIFLILIGMSLAQRLLLVVTGFSWCGVLIGGTEQPLRQVLWVGIGGLVGGAIGLPIGVLTGAVLFWLIRPQASGGLGEAHRRTRRLPRLMTIGMFGFSLLFWYPVVRVQPTPIVQLRTVPCWYTGPVNGYGLGMIYTQPTARDTSSGYYQPPPMRCSDKITDNAEGRWRWVEGTYQSGWVLETYLQLSGADSRQPTASDQPSQYEIRRIEATGSAVVHAGWVAGGHSVFALTTDGGLRVWNTERQQDLRRVDQANSDLLDAAISPDAQVFLIADRSETPQVIDAANGQELHRLKHPVMLGERITSVAFSPDGRSALTAWADGNIRVWDIASGAETLDLWGHERITSVAFTPDGRTIVSAQFGHGVQLWDAKQGKELRLLGPGCYQVTSIAISPDGKTVLSGSAEGSVCSWDLASGEQINRFKVHATSVTSLAWSPDGRSVLSGAADGTIVLWDPASGQARRSLAGHTNMITSLAFHADGKTALSGSWDGTLRVWRLE